MSQQPTRKIPTIDRDSVLASVKQRTVGHGVAYGVTVSRRRPDLMSVLPRFTIAWMGCLGIEIVELSSLENAPALPPFARETDGRASADLDALTLS